MKGMRLEAGEGHVEAFRALAHLTRLKLFFHLVRAGEVAAGDLSRELGVPGPTLTHHLDHLRRCGLIVRRKEARFVRYHVNPSTVSDLVRLLTACC